MVKRLLSYTRCVNAVKDEVENSRWPQILAIVSSSLCLLNVGIVFSWTSPTIPRLLSNGTDEGITLEEASYFSVIPSAIGLPLTPVFTLIIDRIGKKLGQVIAAVPIIISWIIIVIDHSLNMIYLSRAVVGIGVPLCLACTMYVGEIAEPRVRGSWGNCPTIFICLGQLIINVVGSYLDIPTTAFIAMLFAVLQFCMMVAMPETPHFYLMTNKREKAVRSLQLLRWRRNVDEEFSKLEQHVNEEASGSAKLSEVFTNPVHRKCLVVAIGLLAIPQFSGYAAFFTYAHYIFELAGGEISDSTSVVLFSSVYLASMSVSIFYVDKFSRNALLIVSCVGSGTILSAMTVYFYFLEQTGADLSSVSWIPLVGMMLYIAIYSVGLGTIPLLMMGELFASNIKGKALGVINVFFQLITLAIPKLFQVLLSNNGLVAPFSLFAVCCFLGALFSYFCVPQTRGKTLGEIQESMQSQ